MQYGQRLRQMFKSRVYFKTTIESEAGFEPAMPVLQTGALPLGHSPFTVIAFPSLVDAGNLKD